MGNSIFILSTATQAYYLRFCSHLIEKGILIVSVSDKAKADAVFDILKDYNWEKKYWWSGTHRNSVIEVLKIAHIRARLLLLKKQFSNITRVYMGSYTNIYHLSVAAEYERSAKILLLYDGISVMTFAKLRKANNPSIKKFPRLYKVLGFKEPELANLTFVAPYELGVGKNDRFQKIEIGKQSLNKKVLLENKVFFIGQPFLEIGIISKKYYLDSLQWVVDQNKEKELIYLPHPREKEHNLAEIDKIMPVRKLNVVLEEYYLNSESFPKKVISYCSSVLLNLFFFNGDIDIVALKAPQEEIKLEKYVQPFKYNYEFFENLESPLFRLSSLPKNF